MQKHPTWQQYEVLHSAFQTSAIFKQDYLVIIQRNTKSIQNQTNMNQIWHVNQLMVNVPGKCTCTYWFVYILWRHNNRNDTKINTARCLHSCETKSNTNSYLLKWFQLNLLRNNACWIKAILRNCFSEIITTIWGIS